MSRLVIIEGQSVDRAYPLGDMTLIGRDPRCQITLPSREVSAHHARLIRVGTGYLLEDLQSRNRTFVNGEAVSRCRLKNGDRVRIGRTTLRFEAQIRQVPKSPPSSDNHTLGMDQAQASALLAARNMVSPSEGARLKSRLSLFLKISEVLGKAHGLKSTLDTLLDALLEAFPQGARGAVLLLQGAALVPMSSRTKRGHPGEQGYSETIARRVLSEGRGLLSIDALSDDRFSESHSVVDLRLRSVMCAPILFQGRGLGVVEVDTVSSPQMFSEEDLAILSAVASQLGASIANARLQEEYQSLLINQLSTFTLALDSRPVPGQNHGERVSRVALSLGRRLGLSSEELEDLRLGAILHDVGMLCVPESILLKSTPLSDDERQIIRSHTLKGVEILEPITQLRRVLPIVRSHHEFYDGSGYPEGLTGSDIPIGARILAVADAYDAMTEARPHKVTLAPMEALEELQAGISTLYDPEVMTPMVRLVESLARREARRSKGSVGA